MKKDKVYISGPVTSIGIDEARRRFGEAERRLQQMGYKTCSPVKMRLCVWLAQHGCYMACLWLQLLWIWLTADAMLMMADWQKSDGARLERAFARCLRLPVMYADKLYQNAKTQRRKG